MTDGGQPDVSVRAAALGRAADPVSTLRLVDARRAEAFARMGIETIDDLVMHVPFRYLDLSHTADLRTVAPGSDATVVGRVHDIKVKRPRPRLTITEVAIVDGTGALIGVWFNQPYIAQRFRTGERVAFAGAVTLEYGLKQMRNPFVEKLPDDGSGPDIARILPVHGATEGLTTNWIRRLVAEALTATGDRPDPLPSRLRARHDLVPLASALQAIHFPTSAEERDAARRRLAYDELLTVQLVMALRRHRIVEDRPGHAHVVDGERLAALRAAVPFALTDDQVTAVDAVLSDMASPHPMNRMLLGDVGTGKTAVAAHALVACADSDTQAAMMAPTEVLATQYARAVGPLLDAAGVTWALLTGSTPAADRERALARFSDGSITVALGTHALIQPGVTYRRLSLAIVDEQHRFGVGQRLSLREKGEGLDLLVMTATPIPRSLALTVYGDLEVTYLRQRPGGRAADHVTTRLVPRSGRADAYDAVRRAVGSGNRAYIVCPLVDESDATQAKAATSEARRLQRQVFPDLRVGLLTGAMPPAEKHATMERFRAGDVDVLVATTVIEVGVDVPEATIMIVEDAERFGLAQLHQLRGRVGRGERPAEVLLFADPKTADGRARMEAIVSTNDGFELAEHDLRLRGEGDVLGFRQSGLPTLRVASLATDQEILAAARTDARELVDADPDLTAPSHVPLREYTRARLGAAWELVNSG
ncbi:MAG: ATP-dependent DNA helicase RecG [Coriobacteriia bacterium]|nr:ATP-dependent DNA helicase RecG [Coriobacteriia bacterium]